MDRIACFLAGWLWCAMVFYAWVYWPERRKNQDRLPDRWKPQK